MTTEQMIGLTIALLAMLVGCAGSLLPGIPSTPIVLAAAIVHKIYFRGDSAGWFAMILLVGIAAVAAGLDYLATVYGARRFGAGKKGMFGAIVGGLVGLFFNLPGIILGPFIGAALFEMAGGREFKPAVRAGVGATLGLFAGAIGKLFACVAMMVLFIASVLFNTL